ncbi:two-partner secretion domain-containing protein [Candidatus Nitrospira salsa]
MIFYKHQLRFEFTLLFCILISTGQLLSSLLHPSAHAQTPTPHITIDGSLEKFGGNGFQTFTEANVEITQEMGVTHGLNLLHSFGRFNLPTDYKATFSGEPGIANILSRVTGGELSSIDGELASTIQGANVFLMNPAGVVFGQNSSLNVRGSFHITTANQLIFEDGTTFYANPALDAQSNSILQVSSIEDFGFLGNPTTFGFTNETPNTRADIRVTGDLKVDPGKTLSLIGAESVAEEIVQEGVTITGGTLQAPGGRVTVVSIAALQESVEKNVLVHMDRQNFQIFNSQGEIIQDPRRLGGITLSRGARINTSGDGGGTIIIRGGQLTVDRSSILANTTGPANGFLNGEPVLGIDIQVTGNVHLDNESAIETNVLPHVSKNVGSGGVRVIANHVEIANESFIESSVKENSTGGDSGDINVAAQSLVIRDFGSVQAGTDGTSSANGGNITLKARENLEVRAGGSVFAFTDFGSGHSGNIDVETQSLLLSGRQTADRVETSIGSQSFFTGNAGDIQVKADQLNILHAAIFSSTFIDENGNSGNINIDTRGGDVSLSNGFIGANTSGNGRGGLVNLSAQNLELTNQSSVQAATSGSGDAGSITLTVSNNLKLNSGSSIQTRAKGAGNAGNLTVNAKNIVITGISEARNPTQNAEATGFSTTTSTKGKGGDITIGGESIEIKDKGLISSATEGIGKAGDITINLTENLVATNGGQIFANTSNSGNAGKIAIKGKDILISGINPVPTIGPNGIDVSFRTAIASANLGGSGMGGSISLEAMKDLKIEDGAVVATDSLGNGNAGNLVLKGNNSILVDNSSVTTKAQNAVAGNINFEAENFIQIINSEIISEVPEGAGSAGRINIDPQFIVVQGSRIDTSADFGDGGDVIFIADSAILIDPFSTIDTSSRFGGSGTVDIRAPIQNLSESIAPLPEALIKISALFAARCAAQKDGKFSSFVPSGFGGVPPGFSGYLFSPLTFLTPVSENPSTTALRFGFNDRQQESVWKFSATVRTQTTPQGCSAVPARPS